MGVEERIGNKNRLQKLNLILKWENIQRQLKGIHKNEEKPLGGQKAYDVLKMFKAMLLQQWHNLSDPELGCFITNPSNFIKKLSTFYKSPVVQGSFIVYV